MASPRTNHMTAKDVIARNLVAAFLSGKWNRRALLQRGTSALCRREPWLTLLIRHVLVAFETSPSEEQLTSFLRSDRRFFTACRDLTHAGELPLRRLFWRTPSMADSPWPVPPLPTTGSLAEWLGLTPNQLDWFADLRGWEARQPDGPLRHYIYRWLNGRGGKRRLLEQPRPLLKGMQRKILRDILDKILPHEAAHGYRRGRDILSYAAPHVGQRIVLRFDLRDFFPSVRAARARAIFRKAGYPVEVARSLAGLCTNVVPADLAVDDVFRRPHLPQGAPTSPALANLSAYRLDRRLAGLARKLDASYTRYADDLAFSGGESLERSARRFQVTVCRIALEEGFEVNTRKTRFMRRHARQSLAGVVVNEKPNCPRELYDRLKAILTNCARHGPLSQNRDGAADYRSSLAGQVAHLARLNAGHGERLGVLFARIDWSK